MPDPNTPANRLDRLTKLYEADPNDPFCAYGIAMEHAKAQRHQEAIGWLDKTLALDAHYCYAFYQKARMLSEMGQPDQARDTLQQGMRVAQDAGDEHARSEMAQLLESI